MVSISGTKEAIVKCVCQIMKILTKERIILLPTDSFKPQKHGPYIGCLVGQKLNSFEKQEKEMIAKMIEQGVVAIQDAVHGYLQCGPKCPPVQLAIPLIENPVMTQAEKFRGNSQVADPVTLNPSVVENSLSEKLLKIQRDHLVKKNDSNLTFNHPETNQQGSSERNDGPQVDAPQSNNFN